jgi:uncharacterized protein (TIGR02687 family)
MQDTIQEQFDKHPGLRVLFFFDANLAHREELQPWTLAEVRLVEVDGRYFRLKNQLAFEWTEERVFLYFPHAKPTGRDWEAFPLLGLYHANRELLLDEQGRFLEQYRLQAHHLPLVRQYWGELSLKKVQERLRSILDPEYFHKEPLERGLICSALDLNRVEERSIALVKLLTLALEPDKLDKALARIERQELTDLLRHWLDLYFDEKPAVIDLFTVQRLAAKLKYNLLLEHGTKVAEEDTYQKLHIRQQSQVQKLKSLFVDWQLHPQLSPLQEKVLTKVADGVDETRLLVWYGLDRDYAYLTDRMCQYALKQAAEQVIYKPLQVKDWAPRWQAQSEGDYLRHAFEAVLRVADMYALLERYTSFRFNTAAEYLQRYRDDFSRIDFYYRKAVVAFGRLVSREQPVPLEALWETFNQRYEKYLAELNTEWMKLLEERSFDFKGISVTKQHDFYSHYLEKFESKTAVIISDALRYEAAWELLNNLLKDSKVQATLEPVLASIPSFTRLGMTNLLPNDGVEVSINNNGKELDFSINGMPTKDTNQRRQVLKSKEAKSEALTFLEAEKLNEETGRALFRENHLVYIYHNMIDAAGENKFLESDMLNYVETALEKLEKLLKKLYSWNVYHVFITADHGFIFNARPLPETSRENVPKDDSLLKTDLRYLVGKPGFRYEDGYTLPLANSSNIQTDLMVHLPRAVNRFRASAQGVQYAHGGGSLQELVVPVLQYTRHRQVIAETVQVRLLNKEGLRITSGTLKVIFLQEQAVSNQFKKTTLSAALYNAQGALLSTEEMLTFESTSTNPKDRTIPCILTLNAEGSRSSFCYLRVFDLAKDKDRLNPLVDERLMNNSLMEMDEF